MISEVKQDHYAHSSNWYSDERRGLSGTECGASGVTKAAEELGWQVIGFLDGFEGLLPPARYIVLDHTRTHGIMQQGGTILGTSSRGHFVSKVGAGEKMQVPAEIIEKVRQTMADLEIDGLIVVGGDGSLTTALQLQAAGFSIIGVPKTIDNDRLRFRGSLRGRRIGSLAFYGDES